MRATVVTAIYGEYDSPKSLPVDWTAPSFLYTDSVKTADRAAAMGWTPIVDEMHDIATPMLRAKWWKTHPLSAAPLSDVTIWIDGSMTVKEYGFVQLCLDALGSDDIAFTPHPERNCIYPESRLTASLARYGDCNPIAQTDFYSSVVGHPAGWGLFASGAFVARQTELVARWGELWWQECVNWTYQDQLSLPVITNLVGGEGLKWNRNLPWHKWWELSHHGS